MGSNIRKAFILCVILVVLGTTGSLADSQITSDKTASESNGATSITDLGFSPCGWMGDTENIKLDDKFQLPDSTLSGNESVIQIKYIPTSADKELWAGIYWLLPECNWGNETGIDMKQYSKVSFIAKGDKGGEKMEFKVGGVEGKYFDSISPAQTTDLISLTSDWKQYSIDLKRNDLSNVLGGFCWVAKKENNQNGCSLYLKEIVYE